MAITRSKPFAQRATLVLALAVDCQDRRTIERRSKIRAGRVTHMVGHTATARQRGPQLRSKTLRNQSWQHQVTDDTQTGYCQTRSMQQGNARRMIEVHVQKLSCGNQPRIGNDIDVTYLQSSGLERSV